MNRLAGICVLVALVAVGFGCGAAEKESPEAETPLVTAAVKRATANLDPRSDSTVFGVAIFVEEKGKVTIQVDVKSAPPGEHALHIHDVGDCSAPDATSAGAHWNPTDEAHGKWGESPHHLGDIGNIVVDDEGEGSITFTTDRWSIGTRQPNEILGKSVIMHAKPDDFTTQPTGAAGTRIACGVIRLG